MYFWHEVLCFVDEILIVIELELAYFFHLLHNFIQHHLQKETDEDFSQDKLWKTHSLFTQLTLFSSCKTPSRMWKHNFFLSLVILVCLEFSMKIIWSVETAHVPCALRLKNTTSVWISGLMCLFIGLCLHLSPFVTMLPVLHGRGIIWPSCTTIGSSFSTPNDLCGLLCMCF